MPHCSFDGARAGPGGMPHCCFIALTRMRYLVRVPDCEPSYPQRVQHRNPSSSQMFGAHSRRGSASILRSSLSTICRTLCVFPSCQHQLAHLSSTQWSIPWVLSQVPVTCRSNACRWMIGKSKTHLKRGKNAARQFRNRVPSRRSSSQELPADK